MSTRHRAGTLGGAATLITVLAFSAAPTQGAAKRAKPDCPNKALCLWADPNYQGQRVVVKGAKISNQILDEMNDAATSAFLNRKDRVAELFVDADGESESFCLYKGNRRRIKEMIPPYDNAISSTRLKRSVPSSCSL